MIVPGVRGRVAIHGELWRAESESPIVAGGFAGVTAVNGLTLTVAADTSLTRTGDTAWTG